MNLLLIAVAPVLFIIFYVYVHDKYDKEPQILLLGSFLLGAIISVLLVIIIYAITGHLIPLTNKFSIWQQFVQAFIVVALSEEFSKYIIVKYFAQPRKAFNCLVLKYGYRLNII